MNAFHLIAIIASYFLGNFSASYLLTKKILHVDIRTVGSGNAGSTNTLRTLGKKYGALVFLSDFSKGFIAGLGGYLIGGLNLGMICGVACVMGHVFPVLLSFRGGKGVATSLGAFLPLFPLQVAVCLVIAVLVIATTKYVSLGSMTGLCLFSPVLLLGGYRGTPVMAGVAMALFILYTHKENIHRLFQGTERKLGTKSS